MNLILKKEAYLLECFFKKRKNEDTTIYFKKNKNGEDILGPTIKKETKIKNAFEALLDYVREVYFTNDHLNETNPNNNSHNTDNSFKFTSLDLLINPLRKSYPWETWSPYEIALFNCCICKFGTNFDLYLNIITTKKKGRSYRFLLYLEKLKIL